MQALQPRAHAGRRVRRNRQDHLPFVSAYTAVQSVVPRPADAASDTVAVYETATARGATVVIPPARTANVSGYGPRSPARDRTITWVKQLGRRRWKKTSGYHRQSRVENTFFRYKYPCLRNEAWVDGGHVLMTLDGAALDPRGDVAKADVAQPRVRPVCRAAPAGRRWHLRGSARRRMEKGRPGMERHEMRPHESTAVPISGSTRSIPRTPLSRMALVTLGMMMPTRPS